MTIGERLRHLREERGLSISYIAQETGIGRRSFQRWEAGTWNPNTSALLILADFFKVSPSYLLGRDDTLQEEVRKLREDVDVLRRQIRGGNS